MSEILDSSEVCRCCHSSGVFKSLIDPFTHDGNVEVYSDLIREVLGIHIRKPAFAESHTICEQCIMQLRFCRSFKLQVLECERKFQEYCKNLSGVTKAENEDEDIGATQASVDNTKSKEQNATVRTRSFCCEFCNQRFDNKQKLREHEMKKHYNDALCCKICELKFKNHSIRTMHMKKHNATGKGLRCKHCDKYYGSENALIKHINSHFEDDAYKCEICPKTFPYKHTLSRHIEWHKHKISESHNIQLHECNICGMVFKKSSELRTHLVRSHKTHFLIAQNSKKRKIKRRNPVTLQCKECDKFFTASYSLKRHMLNIHIGTKRLKCDLCNGTFSSRGGLNRHMRTVHVGEKERCDICNKEYTNLKEHKARHTKKYKCDKCFKSFSAISDLNRHIKLLHMGVRPFSCHLCDATFTKVEHWRRHLRNRHGVEADKMRNARSRYANTDRIENVSDGINEVMNKLEST